MRRVEESGRWRHRLEDEGVGVAGLRGGGPRTNDYQMHYYQMQSTHTSTLIDEQAGKAGCESTLICEGGEAPQDYFKLRRWRGQVDMGRAEGMGQGCSD
mmetsp:Transcript_2732/g.5790  ORF Transcript_2732/g.5790 Transcript_2732/m.5790 type:complete len:99 (-) Transcript_2732:257-553(-)